LLLIQRIADLNGSYIDKEQGLNVAGFNGALGKAPGGNNYVQEARLFGF
jgi:hypothetical protein